MGSPGCLLGQLSWNAQAGLTTLLCPPAPLPPHWSQLAGTCGLYQPQHRFGVGPAKQDWVPLVTNGKDECPTPRTHGCFSPTSIIDKTRSPLKTESVSRSVMSDSSQPHGLQLARLLCPWDSPGKNSGMDCRSFLQGIFPIQGSNSSLLHCRWVLYHLSHQGRPKRSPLQVVKQRALVNK